MQDELYNSAILTLAAGIPHLGELTEPEGSAIKTARLCGSSISVQVNLDADGKVSEFAQSVKACALGQATASIVGAQTIGCDLPELVRAQLEMRAMLKEQGPAPGGKFSALGQLKDVQNYPQRHASTMLVLDAIVAAVTEAAKKDATQKDAI